MRKGAVNLRLKAQVILSGKTMNEVAKAMGWCKATMSKKVNGITEFTESQMIKMAEILDVPVTKIFFGD